MKDKKAYEAGYDCGKNGANTTNCHFSNFATPELMKEWERGKRQGEKDKLLPPNYPIIKHP